MYALMYAGKHKLTFRCKNKLTLTHRHMHKQIPTYANTQTHTHIHKHAKTREQTILHLQNLIGNTFPIQNDHLLKYLH